MLKRIGVVLASLVFVSNAFAATFTATYTSHPFTTVHTGVSDIPALYLGERIRAVVHFDSSALDENGSGKFR